MHIINPSGSRQFSGRNGAVSATRVQRSFAIRPPNTETASFSLPLTNAMGLSAFASPLDLCSCCFSRVIVVDFIVVPTAHRCLLRIPEAVGQPRAF